MIALAVLLIVGGFLVLRGHQGIGEWKKSSDEESGLTATTKEGYAFMAKVFGVIMVIVGTVMGIVAFT